MNKSGMRKFMLLKKEEETGARVYRVLELAEKVLVIDCVKKTMPVWKGYEELSDFVEVKEEIKTDTLSALEDMNTENRKVAYHRYNLISCILPFLSNVDMRTQAIKKVAEENEISIQSVRSYLCEYLSSMDIRSLAPKKKETERELTVDEKNILHLLIEGTTTAGVGDFANFLIGCAFVVPAGIIYRRKKSRKTSVIGMTVGGIFMIIAGCVLNAFVLLPVYGKAFGLPMEVLIGMGTAVNPAITDLATFAILAVAPFNLLKAVLVSGITLLLYKHISPILKGNRI